MKKTYRIIIIIAVLLVLGIMVFRPGGEDSWIKTKTGLFIKHGYPFNTPNDVLEQQRAISKAKSLYSQKRAQGMVFYSQCLGVIGNYAIDIVHVPRISADNLPENQCEAYRNKEVSHFIELDKFGNVVRIV